MPEQTPTSIYDTLIRPRAFDGVKASDRPFAIIVAGQPGSGASLVARRLQIEASRTAGPIVLASGEFLRPYHPRWKASSGPEPVTALDTRADVGTWYARLVGDGMALRASMVLEANAADTDSMLALAARLKGQGYAVQLVAVAADKDESRLVTLRRYDIARGTIDVPRFVTATEHDQAYFNLREIVIAVEKGKAVDGLRLVQRDSQHIYENRLINGEWSREPRAAFFLDEVRERVPSARQLANYALAWETLVQRLVSDPSVPRAVAAQTLAWRGEAVRRAEQDKDAAKLLTWAREAEAFRRMNRFAFAREFPQHARSVKVLEATVAEAEKYSPEDGAKLIRAAIANLAERMERGELREPPAELAKPEAQRTRNRTEDRTR